MSNKCSVAGLHLLFPERKDDIAIVGKCLLQGHHDLVVELSKNKYRHLLGLIFQYSIDYLLCSRIIGSGP